MNDKWEFSKNNLRKWRWRRITSNGEVVGSGPRGYKIKADCEANARYNGWEIGDSGDQDLVETVSQNVNEPDEAGASSDLDHSIAAPGMDPKVAKDRGLSQPFIQQNLLKLIAIFLGFILIVLILILFKNDLEPELSANSLTNLHVCVETVVTS